MIRRILLATFCLSISILLGCPATPEANTNNGASKPVNGKLPEGLSTKPVKTDGKATPGIPDPKEIKKELPKGTTPTPGIPDPKTIGKTPVPKGATPTPGIPSPEELKKMRERKVDPNAVNRPVKTDKEVTSPIDRKRKVKEKQ